MASVMRVHSSNNIINVIQRFGDWIQRIFSFKRRPKMQKLYGDKNTRMKTDEEYNMEENVRQEEIDHILDKISKSGYDSLTKKEKDFLFRQSKK